jgi:hypothetical protein
VVVAAAAGHGDAEEDGGGGFGEVRHVSGGGLVLFVEELGGIVPRADAEEAGGDEGVLLGGVGGWAGDEFIAGELFADELVERFVG